MAIAIVVAGIFGCLIGSFLNVVIYRVPRKESIVSPGSRCPGCGADVRWYDNVPVVSWLVLRGRCRDCAEPISWRYPAVELLTGALFALAVVVHGVGPQLALDLPFIAMLVAIAMIDLDHRIVPNAIVYPGIVYGIVATGVISVGALPESLIAGLGAYLFLLLAALARPGGMGMGDVKLAGMMGVFLGLAVLPALLAAFLFGSVVGLGIMAARGVAARKQAVPFGPFLALGALVGLFAGQNLIALYAAAFIH
ncbi:MAG: leader peptidase (prepilin peptidase) / N-methyltransferase [Thermoleophilaceae bacterium]|jgi:leader peptidase (prepilin peptidase)/N-methyltransferase|nr:leader peptidase (prepilin peptidase) / N-methyltransferase [Thermoleophilaceae bacterium]